VATTRLLLLLLLLMVVVMAVVVVMPLLQQRGGAVLRDGPRGAVVACDARSRSIEPAPHGVVGVQSHTLHVGVQVRCGPGHGRVSRV
jgi:hypothetical protein